MPKSICNVPNCNAEAKALGMCNKHYQRHHYGKPLDVPDKVEYQHCTVAGCIKPTRSRYADLCAMHYHRIYRYGTLDTYRPLVERPVVRPPAPSIRTRTDVRGMRFGTLTAVEVAGLKWLCKCDCGEARVVAYGELKRAGDANTCGVKRNHLSDDVDYTAAHARVRALRGSASQHRCVDCNKQALHWSYDHADPQERTSKAPATLGIAFSLSPQHYEPRCVPCHKRFDLDRINATEFSRHARSVA